MQVLSVPVSHDHFFIGLGIDAGGTLEVPDL